MFQDYFAQSDHLIWPLLGLLIFVLLFVGVLAYVFLGLRDKDKVDEIAALPLAQDSATDDHPNIPSQADGVVILFLPALPRLDVVLVSVRAIAPGYSLANVPHQRVAVNQRCRGVNNGEILTPAAADEGYQPWGRYWPDDRGAALVEVEADRAVGRNGDLDRQVKMYCAMGRQGVAP